MKAEILKAIEKNDTIIVHRHVRPDPDAIGSQCGLAEIIKASFPDKQVYVVGEDEESFLFLRKMDVIADHVYENGLVVVCDTGNKERISDQRFSKGMQLIKIDHHPNHDSYGDITWVDTTASSTSEMIYELFLYGERQGLKLSKEAARLIYAGIVGDTGRFLFPNTQVKTFKYAGNLLETGIDFQKLYDHLYEKKRSTVKLSGFVQMNFKTTEHGVAYIKLPQSLLQKYDVTPNETSQFIGALDNIKDIYVWVFFVEEADQIRVRIRSKGPVINEVAQNFRGGGHPLASGATIYYWSEVNDVIANLEEACKVYLDK
jgi:phosphoesterase RecJ-like protein